MTNNQKLELTWIGKENQPRLELLLELEGKRCKGIDREVGRGMMLGSKRRKTKENS